MHQSDYEDSEREVRYLRAQSGPLRSMSKAVRSLLVSCSTLALLISTNPVVAFDIQGNATETVNGLGGGTQASPWNVGAALNVGVVGNGTLNVINGGQVSGATSVTLGQQSGTASIPTLGFVTLTDGSSFNNSGFFIIGAATHTAGSLSIFSGSQFNQTVAQTGMATNVNSIGTLVIDGVGGSVASKFETSSDFQTGAGDANIFINSDSLMKVDGQFVLANQALGDTTIDVNGNNAQLEVLSNASIGGIGTATINLSNGGSATFATLLVGDGTSTLNSGSGTINVDGSGTVLATGGSATHIGRFATGLVTLANNGLMTASAQVTLGQQSSGNGRLEVTNNATANFDNRILVGDAGTGTLLVSSGGVLTSGIGFNSASVIASSSGSTGQATVTGIGSKWDLSGRNLVVGQNGTGTLNIFGGGEVSNFDTLFVSLGAGDGTVNISDSNSKLVANSDIRVSGNSTGTGVINVANGGELSQTSGNILLTTSVNGIGIINIGGAVNSAAAGAGTITTTDIIAGSGAASLNFNHTDTNYDFSTKLTGGMTVNNTAGVTKLTGDLSAFTGVINVNGGTLFTNTTIANASAIDVNGGTLGGSGTINLLSVASGGTLAPGNSIGTLAVTGNASLGAGSTYSVEIDDGGNSDLLDVGGTLTIDPTAVVTLSPENGTDDGSTYTAGQVYTIANAAGGVSGTFASITDSFAFIDGTLGYTANSVTVTIATVANFSSAATTSNQTNVANAAQALGSGNSVFNALSGLTTAQAQDAFDALSGEVHASAKSAFISDSRYLRDASFSRLQDDKVEGAQAWLQFYGGLTSLGSNANAADTDVASGGLIAGIESSRDDWQGGIALQIGTSNISVDGSRASELDSNDYGVGAYSAFNIDNMKLAVGASYTSHDIEAVRSVAFGGLQESLVSDYDASTAQFFAKLSTDVDTVNGVFTPFAQLAYVRHKSDAFTESGGSAALSSGPTNTSTTFTLLGVSAKRMIDLENGKSAKVRGTIGWLHAFGDTSASADMSFAQGDNFAIEGASIARDALVFDLGTDLQLNDRSSLDINYSGQIGTSGSHTHSINAGLSVKF